MFNVGLTATVEFELDCDHSLPCPNIFVGVVTYIGTYCLLSAYYLSTYHYKRMRLLTRFYGITQLKSARFISGGQGMLPPPPAIGFPHL